MYTIINKQNLAKDIKRIDVLAEGIARHAQPGQFVLVVPEAKSEWIPLSIVEADTVRGTIALIFQERGEATRQLGAVPINDGLYSVMGPLGQPAKIEARGTVVCASVGIGVASMLSIARALRRAENKVISLISAKSKRSVLLEPQTRLTSHRLVVATEDRSHSRRGTVVDLLKEVMMKEKVGQVYAVGPTAVLREIGELTRQKKIPCRVIINTIMYCGNGICGSCRVDVSRQTLLSCVHGPVFDGHKVDYDKLDIRLEAIAKGRELGEQEMSEQRGALGKLWTSLMKE